MITRYRVINWDFNKALWALVIQGAIDEFGVKAFAEIVDVDTSTLSNWAHMTQREGHKWPQMQNFMKVVNVLDLTPSDFFILEE